MIGSTPWGLACLDLLRQLSKSGRIQECWQVLLIVGGVRNGATKEDGHWDLNLGAAAIEVEGHVVRKESREDHVVLECFFWPRGLGSRRDFARKKRGERTLTGGL